MDNIIYKKCLNPLWLNTTPINTWLCKSRYNQGRLYSISKLGGHLKPPNRNGLPNFNVISFIVLVLIKPKY